MGTLWQVLNDYATNLKSVQHVARLWHAGPGDYSVMQPRLTASLTEIATQRDILRPAIASSMMPEEYRTLLDRLVFDSYTETEAIVLDPTNETPFGGMKALGVAAEAETALKLADRLGKQLLRLVYFLTGASITIAVYVKVIDPLVFDPNGIKAGERTWKDAQESCARVQASCAAGDAECAKYADAYCKHIKMIAMQDLPGDESCGPLDTPYGTLVGLVLGIGFGWAGMRKVMGL